MRYLLLFLYLLAFPFGVSSQSVEIVKNLEDSKEYIDSLNIVSEKELKSQPQHTLYDALKACKLARKVNYSKGLVLSLNNLGRIYYNLGDFQKALEYLFQAVKISAEIQDEDRLGQIYNDIGMCHRSMGDFREALIYHKKAKEIYKGNNDLSGYSRSLNNIGICQFSLNEDGADSLFKLSLELYEKVNVREGIAMSMNNLAIFYSSRGEYKEAKKYFSTSLGILRNLNNNTAVQMCLNNLGKLYLLQGNYPLAERYLDSSMEMNKQIQAKESLLNNYTLYQQLYEETNDYKKSLEYQKLLSQLKDSLYQEKKTEHISRLNTIFKVEAKQQELEVVQVELKLKKKQSLFLIIVIINLLVIAMLIFLVLRSRLRMARNKQVLLQREKELEILQLENKKRELRQLEENRQVERNKYENEISEKNRELTAIAMRTMQRKGVIEEIRNSLLTHASKITQGETIKSIVSQINKLLDDDSWEQFSMHFKNVHPDFFTALKQQ